MSRTPLVAGNWKMNGLPGSAAELRKMIEALDGGDHCDVLVCPPFPLIAQFVWDSADSGIEIGAQDCHTNESGAHTGDVSAALIAAVGASAVILGHSERRADHGETDALVKVKAEAALAAGLLPIVCVGETEAQRDAGEAEGAVLAQLAGSLPDDAGVVVAYEPVWAIGTGRVPGMDDIAAMHAAIRRAVVGRHGEAGQGIRLLYGGSVKPGNAAEIFAIDDVDGGLIGGASLKADDFLGIVAAA